MVNSDICLFLSQRTRKHNWLRDWNKTYALWYILQSCTKPSIYATMNLDIIALVNDFTAILRRVITGRNNGLW